MTNDELAAIAARANAATAGPWVYDGYDAVEAFGPHGRVSTVEMPKDWHEGSEYTGSWSTAAGNGDDLLFCAAARTDIPALVAEVRRLRGLVREAYCEGSRHAYADHKFDWADSDARKALDA